MAGVIVAIIIAGFAVLLTTYGRVAASSPDREVAGQTYHEVSLEAPRLKAQASTASPSHRNQSESSGLRAAVDADAGQGAIAPSPTIAEPLAPAGSSVTTTTSGTSASSPLDSEAGPEPSSSVGQWSVLFSDEFHSLNRAVWHTSYEWHPVVINDELQYYSDDHVTVENGFLILSASETPQGGQLYSSGMISSHDRFSFTYGRIEMRGKLPAGQGFWPAFWLMPADHSWPPFTVSCAFHWKDSGGMKSHDQVHSGPDYSSGFHTYVLEWEPDKLAWYVDGELCTTYTDESRIPQKPMYVLANLAVGGAFVGPPDPTTVFPAAFAIDYIRVWQRDGS
jgi:beta-glucanase (GH16 family)